MLHNSLCLEPRVHQIHLQYIGLSLFFILSPFLLIINYVNLSQGLYSYALLLTENFNTAGFEPTVYPFFLGNWFLAD